MKNKMYILIDEYDQNIGIVNHRNLNKPEYLKAFKKYNPDYPFICARWDNNSDINCIIVTYGNYDMCGNLDINFYLDDIDYL